MSVEFKSNWKDYFWLNIDLHRKARGTYITIIILAVIIFYFFGNDCSTLEEQIGYAFVSLLISCALICCLILFFSSLGAYSSKKYFKGHENSRVDISPEGISVVCSLYRGIVSWVVVNRVVTGHNRIYVQVHKFLYIIVPVRAFSSVVEFEEFKQKCINYSSQNFLIE